MPACYLDSSAIVKLAAREPESSALRQYLHRRRPLVSSALARTEVLRALLGSGAAAVQTGRDVLARLDLMRVNNTVLDAAGVLSPTGIRSLDAVHLATAAQLGEDLRLVVTYDERMAGAARQLGLRVAAPR